MIEEKGVRSLTKGTIRLRFPLWGCILPIRADHFAFTKHPEVKGGTKSANFASHKRTKYVQSHLHMVLRIVKFRHTKSYGGCQGLGGDGNRELVFNGYSFSWRRQKFLGKDSGDGCVTV